MFDHVDIQLVANVDPNLKGRKKDNKNVRGFRFSGKNFGILTHSQKAILPQSTVFRYQGASFCNVFVIIIFTVKWPTLCLLRSQDGLLNDMRYVQQISIIL